MTDESTDDSGGPLGLCINKGPYTLSHSHTRTRTYYVCDMNTFLYTYVFCRGVDRLNLDTSKYVCVCVCVIIVREAICVCLFRVSLFSNGSATTTVYRLGP